MRGGIDSSVTFHQMSSQVFQVEDSFSSTWSSSLWSFDPFGRQFETLSWKWDSAKKRNPQLMDRITIEVSGNVTSTSGPISNYRSLSVVSSNNWVNKHIGFDICNLNGFWSCCNFGNILGMGNWVYSFSQLVVFCEDECFTFHKPRNTLVQNYESRSYRSRWLMDNGQGSNENLYPVKIHRCSLSMMKVILVCPTDCSKCQYMAAPVFVFSLLVCNHRPVFQ